jgi:ATP:corrinoid adenosyltransferase
MLLFLLSLLKLLIMLTKKQFIKEQLYLLNSGHIIVKENNYHCIYYNSTKHPSVEIVLTGRYADPKLIAVADLVTEMKEIKHYFKAGVKARIGIEK